MTTTAITPTASTEVLERLDRHILADGMEMVLDLEKSHGAFIHDALTGREILDLFGC